MTLVRLAIAWHDRARANDLPASVVGGVALRTFRCPDCGESWADPEVAFQHVMSEHGKDRRRKARVA